MPRPKGASTWNEELVEALRCRADLARQQGKRSAMGLEKAADTIQAVRGDIYTFKNYQETGRIVNFPKLPKAMESICRKIISRAEPITPDGYVATGPNHQHQQQQQYEENQYSGHKINKKCGPQECNTNDTSSNPFWNDYYLNNLKRRGGAYAILIAFHLSSSQTMTKAQIIKAAQPFCDDAMEANFHAGRNFGAWKAIDTLNKHKLVLTNNTSYFDGQARGFRSLGPHQHTLTDDGKLFIQAMFEKYPDIQDEIRNIVGYSYDRRTSASFSGATKYIPLITPPPKHAKSEQDEVELEEWALTAQIGDEKEFDISKDRRLYLHRCCDRLNENYFKDTEKFLRHESNGSGRSRTLQVKVVRKYPNEFSTSPQQYQVKGSHDALLEGNPSSFLVSAVHKTTPSRKFASGHILYDGSSQKRPRNLPPPKVAAAQAALSRQALFLSTQPTSRQLFHDDPELELSEEEQLQKALRESAVQAAASPKYYEANGAIVLSKPQFYSEEEQLQLALQESCSAKIRTLTTYSEDEDKVRSEQQALYESAQATSIRSSNDNRNSTIELLDNDSEDENDRKRPANTPFRPLSRPTNSQINNSSQVFNVESEDVQIVEQSPCHRVKDEEKGKKKSKKDKVFVDLSDESSAIVEVAESPRPVMLVDLVDPITEDDSNRQFAEFQNSSDESRNVGVHKESPVENFVVYIDDRERNKNNTPRTLRMELTRIMNSTGPLGKIWPRNLPPASIKERHLKSGDFSFLIENNDNQQQQIPLWIERKRIGDLVQRSHSKEHWFQLQIMRDEAHKHDGLCLFVLEGDFRTAIQHTPYNAQKEDIRKPQSHTIDNEESILYFMFRALFSTRKIRFLQTLDEQNSLRAIGALSLMALHCKKLKPFDFTSTNQTSKGDRTSLQDRLQHRGIPWQLARRVSEEIGSESNLEYLYETVDEECRPVMLMNTIADLVNDFELHGTCFSWSEAIHRCFASKLEDPRSGRLCFDISKQFTQDHANLLTQIHAGYIHPEEAVNAVFENTKTMEMHTSQRVVSILLPAEAQTVFEDEVDNGASESKFYTTQIDSKQARVPAIVMQTDLGRFRSNRIFAFLVDGKQIVEQLHTAFADNRDCISVACQIAESIKNDCYSHHARVQPEVDTVVLLLTGLNNAINQYMKEKDCRSEVRVIADLLLAELSLHHDMVIIHAIRLHHDRQKIIRQLALAAYHFQILTKTTTQVIEL